MSNLDLQLQSNLPTTRNIKSWWSLKEGGRLSKVRAWGFIFRLILQNGDLTLSPTLIEIYRNNFKRLVEGKKEIAIYGDCFIFRGNTSGVPFKQHLHLLKQFSVSAHESVKCSPTGRLKRV